MNRIIRGIGVSALAVVSLSLFTGCADRLTYENYSRIQVQRSDKAEVRYLIGRPDHQFLGNKWEYNRPGKVLHVYIDFDADGIVERKQWIDAQRWSDTGESGASGEAAVRESSTDIRHHRRP